MNVEAAAERCVFAVQPHLTTAFDGEFRIFGDGADASSLPVRFRRCRDVVEYVGSVELLLREEPKGHHELQLNTGTIALPIKVG